MILAFIGGVLVGIAVHWAWMMVRAGLGVSEWFRDREGWHR